MKGDKVFVNGSVLDDSYAIWKRGGAADFDEVKVPAGMVFVLGDNRDFSKDSRFWETGPFLPVRNIRGRAFVIYFSFAGLRRAFTILK